MKLGYAQRAAAHFASETDVLEAVACGEAAVKAALEGKSGQMVTLVRTNNEGDAYTWTTGLEPLENIANVEHLIPRDWISTDGFLPNEKFIAFAKPLIEGEHNVPTKNGLPAFVKLEKEAVEKQLPKRGSEAPAPEAAPEPAAGEGDAAQSA